MELGGKFGLPVIPVEHPGAYPGKGAEERGRSEAIARATEKMLQVGVPLVSVIIGEGDRAGLVAFATAIPCAPMLEHSVYSVISPEGLRVECLWKDAEKDARSRRSVCGLTSARFENSSA